MSNTSRAVIDEFFRRVGGGEPVENIGALFSEQVDWYVAGDTHNVPWIGRKKGKAGAAEFYAQIREYLLSEAFSVDDILTQGNRVLAVGKLASRMIKTGKLMETEFCLDFTVEQGEITRFRMFEDSFAVAQAAV